jgi:hypothetical protein
MRKLKINSNPMFSKVEIFHVNHSKKELDLDVEKKITYDQLKKDLGFVQNKKIEYEVREHFVWINPITKPKKYLNYLATGEFDKWCSFIESVDFDFHKEFNASVKVFDFCENVRYEYWQVVVNEFMGAVKEYLTQKSELNEETLSEISNESARRFLFLAPLLVNRKYQVYIDSTNGCVNVDFGTRNNEVLSTFISDNGHVHYSLVAENKKIYKLSGTAKFKDSRDFIKFNKVLGML